MYSTWQAFEQALLVDNPLLLYIDIRHVNFLPPRLTIGEALDLGPRYTCSDELTPIRDESAKRVSRHHCELTHQQVEQENPPLAEPEAPTQEEEAVRRERKSPRLWRKRPLRLRKPKHWRRKGLQIWRLK